MHGDKLTPHVLVRDCPICPVVDALQQRAPVMKIYKKFEANQQPVSWIFGIDAHFHFDERDVRRLVFRSR